MGIKDAFDHVARNYDVVRKKNITSSNMELSALMQALVDELKNLEVLKKYQNIEVVFSKGQGNLPSNPAIYLRDRRESTSGTKGVYIYLAVDLKTYADAPALILSFTQGREGLGTKSEAPSRAAKLKHLQLKARGIAESYVAEQQRNDLEGFSYADQNLPAESVYIARKTLDLYSETDLSIERYLNYLCSFYSHYVKDYYELSEADRVFRLMSVEIRKHQTEFKERVLKYYNQCVVTGCSIIKALDAAHIIPHSEYVNFNTANGLILRSDIHRLYDAKLLSINENGVVNLEKSLRANDCYKYLHGKKVTIPLNPDSIPYIKSRTVS